MPRKIETLTVPTSEGWERNRDARMGKVFRITEFPAAKAEKWAARALLLLKNNGAQIPDNVTGLGIVGVAILGLNVWLQGDIKFEELSPLMDEMMEAVEIVRDPRRAPDKATQIISPDDIEEVQTLLWLRSEVLRLHTGFSVADAVNGLISAAMSSPASSPNTPTSPPASD